MIRKLPIIDAPAGCLCVMRALARAGDPSIYEDFKASISGVVNGKYVYLTNSATAAFYLILKALARTSSRKEVILPAYTAGNLVVAVQKAGLRPVLCDIKFSDFNMDAEEALKAVCEDTLAVVAVHMFGVGMGDISQLAGRLPEGVFLIEDCAQSMGTYIGGKPSGSFGDISFFSFNRGKNLSLCGGGCMATDDAELAQCLGGETKGLREPGVPVEILRLFKNIIVSFALNPYIYGLGYAFAGPFKSKKPPRNFAVRAMNRLKAGCGVSLTERAGDIFAARQSNGAFLTDILKGLKSITLPAMQKESRIVFNRMPILFKDGQTALKVQKALWKAGIETSRMYFQPLHHMFNLGYMHDEFPNACYFAERVLTLPIHPSVTEEDLLKMADVIISEAG